MMCTTLKWGFLLLLIDIGRTFGAWQDGVQIQSTFTQDELDIAGSFKGHAEDHLTLLRFSGNNILVGGRDAFYNFSVQKSSYGNDLNAYSTIDWVVPEHNLESCQFKGQTESKCHNFVRSFHGPFSSSLPNPKALALTSENDTTTTTTQDSAKYLACGTNGFKPTCKWYSPMTGWSHKEFSGVGYTPFDPTHMSTSIFHHDNVYSATVADFGATDALIYKQPLRTEQHSTLHLNSPSWVSALSYGDLALFFFRENAIEHSNCGKAIFSRVARICRHDNGSRRQDRFTTFLKARLNCSIPGPIPFYFDYIQGTTDILMNSERKEEMLYAVFTTAENSIRASAVCSFSTRDILAAFDGPFKGQKSPDGNWLPVPETEVPSPRPGACSNDPKSQDSASAAFLKGHALMDLTVQGIPLLTITNLKDTFTTIDVDNSPEVSPYHVLYIGTESGKVLKAVVNASSGQEPLTLETFSESSSAISQSWDVFPGERIKSLKVMSGNRLLVLSENRMRVIRVDNCDKFFSCAQCLRIRDPHCGWDTVGLQCLTKDSANEDKSKDEQFIQDISGVAKHLCPIEEIRRNEILDENQVLKKKSADECCSCTPQPQTDKPTETDTGDVDDDDDTVFEDIVIIPQQNNDSNEIPDFRDDNQNSDYTATLRSSGDASVSTQSLALATSSSAVLSLLVGFSIGFIVAKYVSRRERGLKAPKNLTANLNESQRLTKSIDYAINVPKSANNPLKNNLNTSVDSEKTVKKIYL